jgi:hypothetical protein
MSITAPVTYEAAGPETRLWSPTRIRWNDPSALPHAVVKPLIVPFDMEWD